MSLSPMPLSYNTPGSTTSTGSGLSLPPSGPSTPYFDYTAPLPHIGLPDGDYLPLTVPTHKNDIEIEMSSYIVDDIFATPSK
jgi:hypothetical protein